MKYLYICMMLMVTSLSAIAEHDGHVHEIMVDGKALEVSPERFANFTSDLSNARIAIVSVKGMVCDFCARGIEKMFKKDKAVIKIDVDLDKGKVVIAYNMDKIIDFEDIKQKILANGQNAVDLQVLELQRNEGKPLRITAD